jgi:serine/threonine protein kinase
VNLPLCLNVVEFLFVRSDVADFEAPAFPEEIKKHYVVKQLLGDGTFGKVYLAHKRIHIGNQATCVVKVIKKIGSHHLENIRQAQAEVNLLTFCEHVS